MEYQMVELDGFELMGKEYPLSDSLENNIRLAQNHWRNFNYSLRKNKVHLGRNWLKYAFVIEKEEGLYYYIAVPKKNNIPEGFCLKTIPKCRYLMIKHVGSMKRLKDSVDNAYDVLKNDFHIKYGAFSYFERYDYRFHWSRPDSVIEIYFPIKDGL